MSGFLACSDTLIHRPVLWQSHPRPAVATFCSCFVSELITSANSMISPPPSNPASLLNPSVAMSLPSAIYLRNSKRLSGQFSLFFGGLQRFGDRAHIDALLLRLP